jgi:hypothetical protein
MIATVAVITHALIPRAGWLSVLSTRMDTGSSPHASGELNHSVIDLFELLTSLEMSAGEGILIFMPNALLSSSRVRPSMEM